MLTILAIIAILKITTLVFKKIEYQFINDVLGTDISKQDILNVFRKLKFETNKPHFFLT